MLQLPQPPQSPKHSPPDSHDDGSHDNEEMNGRGHSMVAAGREDNKGHNNQIVGWGARALMGDRVKGTEWRGRITKI